MQDKNEHLLEKIFLCTGDSIIVADREGTIRMVNPATEEMLGYSNSELSEKNITLIMHYDTGDAQKNNPHLPSFIAKGLEKKTLQNLEICYKTKDNHYLPIHLSCSALWNDNREIEGFICIGRDIRDIKEKTAEIIHREKLTLSSEVIASISHELNQPLNNIQIIAQSILRDISRDSFEYDEDELQNDMQEIKDHIKNMSRIIDHSRRFTGTNNGETKEKIDINTLVRSPFTILSTQLQSHNINVSFDLAPDLPPIVGDTIQLEQVLMTIINHTKKHLDRTQKENKKIIITTGSEQLEENHQSIIINIADNSDGIPEEQLIHIFDPFFATSSQFDSTAWGLKMAQRIIEHHKGILDVDSKTGEGTTFSLILPAFQ